MELSAADLGAGALRDCYAPAVIWADAFWNGLFDRCASQGAAQPPHPLFQCLMRCE